MYPSPLGAANRPIDLTTLINKCIFSFLGPPRLGIISTSNGSTRAGHFLLIYASCPMDLSLLSIILDKILDWLLRCYPLFPKVMVMNYIFSTLLLNMTSFRSIIAIQLLTLPTARSFQFIKMFPTYQESNIGRKSKYFCAHKKSQLCMCLGITVRSLPSLVFLLPQKIQQFSNPAYASLVKA